jgi:hypothetical protein
MSIFGKLIKFLFRFIFKTKSPIEMWGNRMVGITFVFVLALLLYAIEIIHEIVM